jgi:hypothetical protein
VPRRQQGFEGIASGVPVAVLAGNADPALTHAAGKLSRGIVVGVGLGRSAAGMVLIGR